MFNVQLALGNLVGNRNLGPSLPLALSYSPLTWTDAGFGRGVSLGLTTYDTDNRLLALSTGEQYKIQETDSEVILRQNRLDTVHVTKDDTSYRITHKSGDVEILTGPQNAFTLKVPTALLTPAGRRLDLTWDFGAGSRPRLKEVDDENDTLLTIDYIDNAKATLHVLPDQPEGYDVELWFRNALLGSVHHFGLGADTPLVWEFTYDTMGPQGEWGEWITGVTMPGGMSETAYYPTDGQGHQFPDSAGLPALPYVYRFVQQPGNGQPNIEVSYSYTGNNFVGGNSGVSWDADQDNLYEVMTAYTYGSTESRVCAGQTTRITRTYNQYHLQTAETTAQNGCSRTVEIDYYAAVGRELGDQPAQFQLPKTRTVTWTDALDNTRSEVTQTSFDEAGNPRDQTDPDGIRTEWTYYPAAGSGSDCPPEPNGFTRLLKDVTRTPPGTGFDAPVHKTSYRYQTYAGSLGTEVASAVLKSEERHYADGQLLKRATFDYETAGVEFGRLTSFVETEYPDGADGASYDASHTFGFKQRDDALAQTHTLTTHDGLRLTRSQTRSRFTGRLRSTTDAQANVATSSYDNLGRPVAHTLSPNTQYQAQQTRDHQMGGSAPFVVTTTDLLGNQLRDSLDGAGRRTQRERKDIDGNGAWHTVETVDYDEQGRVSSTTTLDQVPGGGAVQSTRTFAYYDWGHPRATTFDDGASHLTWTDPVAQTTTTQLAGAGTPVTGKQVTTHNTRGEPVRVERFDLTGTSAGRRTLERDGWGRLRRDTDELGNATRYDYDAHGRLANTTLPDGTRISYTYAPFSSAALVTGLAVNGASHGTQTFDGLGRLTASSSGGRNWSYRYTGASAPLPSSVTAPDNQVRAYQYVPQLDNAVSQVQAGSITRQVTRDQVSGSVTNAQEGGVTIARGYYPSGRLHTDTTTLSGQSAGTATSSYTVGGLELSYTGVDGTTQQIGRDAYGRISAVTDPAMRATLNYDAAGRVTGWAATDPASGHTVTTVLALDDFGREVKRTITDNQGTSWTLTQVWQHNNLLSRRTFSRGTTQLRDESFTYNSRNQLTTYACGGGSPALDDHGNAVTGQTFTYDAYGNVTSCQTTFPSGADTATYHYDNTSDPCQLTGISHTHPSYPSRTDLAYDRAGRLITDDAGRTLTYDPLGRLQSVGPAGQYGYDPLDRLITQTAGTHTGVLHYRRGSLAALTDGDQHTRLLRLAQTCLAQHRGTGNQADTWLLGADGKQTVLIAAGAGQQREEYAYTPYGSRPLGTTSSVLGFDGQRVDPVLGWYHLGNGYRPYHPGLMRFTAPDSLSPFGAGGINPYTYCLGDPINRVDPSGQLSWLAWLGIGIAAAFLAVTVVTGIGAIVAAGGVMAALAAASTTELVVGALSVVSDVTAIASNALEEASPKASSILGWVSLGTGLGGGVVEGGVTAARNITRSAERVSELGREVQVTTEFTGEATNLRPNHAPAREFDAPTETFYRGMSQAEHDSQLVRGGLLPRTENGESFVTQQPEYITGLARRHPDNYRYLVKFDMSPGTEYALDEQGAWNAATRPEYDSRWIESRNIDQVHLKTERNSMNYGLRWNSVQTFNGRISRYSVVGIFDESTGGYIPWRVRGES